MKTIKVKPWGKDQGDHVVINEEDFNPSFHELLDDVPDGAKKAPTVPEIKATLEAAGVTVPDGAKKADLVALLTAFERSGLSGAEWNSLADEDRAARIAQ